jgi:hypothetical protein
VNDPYPPKILNNPKFWPFLKDAIGALDGTHIIASPPLSSVWHSRITEDPFCRIASFPVTSIYYLYTHCVDRKDLRQMHDLTVPEGNITLLM